MDESKIIEAIKTNPMAIRNINNPTDLDLSLSTMFSWFSGHISAGSPPDQDHFLDKACISNRLDDCKYKALRRTVCHLVLVHENIS